MLKTSIFNQFYFGILNFKSNDILSNIFKNKLNKNNVYNWFNFTEIKKKQMKSKQKK